jgi:hypothetical protein
MPTRRDFITRSSAVIGTSLVGGPKAIQSASVQTDVSSGANARAFDMSEDYSVPDSMSQQDRFEFTKTSSTDFKGFVSYVMNATPVDAVVGISENAINNFLQAHFNDTPGFYNRSRESGSSPIYQIEFDDHGIKRTFRFFAKVVQDPHKAPLYVNLIDTANNSPRYIAYWRARAAATHSKRSATDPGGDAPPPPNVELVASHVVLQIDIPRLDAKPGDSDPFHHLDLDYQVDIETYVSLEPDSSGDVSLQLTDWDILLTPLSDPLSPPASGVWGPIAAGCEQALAEARLTLPDLVTVGANIALTQLCKTLAKNIPLPPISVVKGANLVPRELFVLDKHIGVSACISPSASASNIADALIVSMRSVQREIFALDVEEFKTQYPSADTHSFHLYAMENSPSYKEIYAKNDVLAKQPPGSGKGSPSQPFPGNDIFVMLSNNFFSVLAKSLLHSDVNDCTPWQQISVLIAYLQGRACYWFDLSNAFGGLSGTSISMGCDVNAGGKLDLEACLHVPCAPDACATWSPGLGLKGPLQIAVQLVNLTWSQNSALLLHPSVGAFPGLQVYGFFDPVIEDVVNFLLGFISGAVFTAFFNAVLSAFNLVLIQFPVTVPKTSVKMNLSHFGASNVQGMLAVTGTCKFT